MPGSCSLRGRKRLEPTKFNLPNLDRLQFLFGPIRAASATHVWQKPSHTHQSELVEVYPTQPDTKTFSRLHGYVIPHLEIANHVSFLGPKLMPIQSPSASWPYSSLLLFHQNPNCFVPFLACTWPNQSYIRSMSLFVRPPLTL